MNSYDNYGYGGYSNQETANVQNKLNFNPAVFLQKFNKNGKISEKSNL